MKKNSKTKKGRKMKAILVILAVMGLAMLLATGCDRQEIRDTAHQAILEYLENDGQARAVEYIDQLVADGKLGAANAEKLKAAIPLGIEKLREVMGELEAESAASEAIPEGIEK